MRIQKPELTKPAMLYIMMAILVVFIEIIIVLMSMPGNEENLTIKAILSVLVIPLVIGIIFILAHISNNRKATLHLKEKPKRLLGFITNKSPQRIIEQVTLIASTYNYTIEDIDESKGRIIVSSPITWISWGFFYPVYV